MIELSTEQSRISRRFTLLGAAQVTLIAAITLIVVPLPAIQREFELAGPSVALLSAAYGLSFGGLLLVGGRLADRFGPRRVLLVGTVIFGVGALAGGLAATHGLLLGARFAQGAGAALIAPAALALVAHLYPSGIERARAHAIWGTLSVTGAVGGAVLSGFIGALGSWRPAVLAPAAVAAVILACHRLLPTTAPRPTGLALVDGVLITFALVGLSAGVLQRIPLLVLFGGLALAWFLMRQARSARPLLPLSLITRPARGVALAVVWLVAAVSATSTLLLSLYLQQIQGRTPLMTSLAFLPLILVIATGPISARLLPRYGVGPVTVLGLLLAAAAMGWLSRLDPGSAYATGLLPAVAAFAIGSGIAFAGATVSALRRVPVEHGGVAGGVVNTALEAGPTFGLALLLAVATARTDAMEAAGAAADRAATGGYAAVFGAAALALLLIVPIVLYTFMKEEQE